MIPFGFYFTMKQCCKSFIISVCVFFYLAFSNRLHCRQFRVAGLSFRLVKWCELILRLHFWGIPTKNKKKRDMRRGINSKHCFECYLPGESKSKQHDSYHIDDPIKNKNLFNTNPKTHTHTHARCHFGTI